MSYDRAKTWVFLPNLPVGLFYHVSFDMATPYNVCGGMQDNYDWCGPSAVRGSAGIANHQWTTVQGGDGFVVLQDPTNHRVAYSESQNGNMVRVDRVTGETMSVRPQAGDGAPDLRWNWDTPLVMSPHDPTVIYAAANKVFRSTDRGLSWTAISPDLTEGANRDDIVTMGIKGSDIRIAKNDGISAWPTIVSFAESPKRAGLLYAGTDDGNLAVSKDAGKTWANVFAKVPGVPADTYVSKVAPSRFDEATVYATFDGHRNDDFRTYIYASHDYGQTWQSIAANLSGEVARTLTEDLKNPDVLYLGTETGLFVTIDRGGSWTRIKANLPDVRIDEIVLHPRDNAMILATHGRALWILDHLEPIQEYAAAQAAPAARLFTLPPYAMYRRPARDRNYEFWGDQTFFGENPPQAAVIAWHLKQKAGDVKLRVTDASGREVREIGGDALAKSTAAGIQTACWDLRVAPGPEVTVPNRGGSGGEADREETSPFGAGCASGGGSRYGRGGTSAGPFVLPGTYTVSLVVDGKAVDSKPLKVVADPEVALTSAERAKMFEMAVEAHALQGRVTEVANALAPLNRQMAALAKTLAGRAGVPADVKGAFEALEKERAALAPKFAVPARRFGGASDSLLVKVGQAKNELMGGMWPTATTLKAFEDAKRNVPKAVADANAFFTKAAAVAETLKTYDLKLDAPAPIK